MINWNNRRIINAGSSGIVYAIDGNAVKVGWVEKFEVMQQQYFHTMGLALPILYYERWMIIPADVSKEACMIHGCINDFYGDAKCSCHKQRRDVLVMPLAESVEENEETLAFSAYIHGLSLTIFNRGRDTRIVNIGRYDGKLIGLDWG